MSRINIICKSFDGPYCKQILESAFEGKEIGSCFAILNDTEQMPDIDTEQHVWIPAAPLRAGEYPDVEWEKLFPLDAQLIQDMRDTEAIFYTMIERYALGKELWYGDRKAQYYQHLRYWNDFLKRNEIKLLLLNHVPHQGYDFVLYNLCKLRGIPTYHVERAAIMDAFFLVEDWKESGKEIADVFKEIDETPLSPNYEKYFEQFTKQDDEVWFVKKAKPNTQKGFVGRWWKVALQMVQRKPLQFLKGILSPRLWKRKLDQHAIIRTYENNIKEPDLTKKFIYVPLHMQPEATTCPMGGVFTDQEHMISLLAACIPNDVQIYIKEHPFQSEVCRSIAFYEQLLALPNVTFVPRNYSTFALADKAVAIASITGTAAFEGIMKGKPIFLFGHRFFQYAPGMFRIRSEEDCRSAVKAIFEQNAKPKTDELRRFFKAMETVATPYPDKPHSPVDDHTDDEKAVMMGQKIGEKIAPHFA